MKITFIFVRSAKFLQNNENVLPFWRQKQYNALIVMKICEKDFHLKKKAGSFLSELDYKDYEEVRVQGLHEFLDYVQQRCNEIGGAIGEKFF